MATDFVYIKHADVESLGGPVERSAAESLWKDKGWTVASDEDVASHTRSLRERQVKAASLTAEDVDAVRKRSDLDRLALDRGVDPTQHENMQTLAEAVKATL